MAIQGNSTLIFLRDIIFFFFNNIIIVVERKKYQHSSFVFVCILRLLSSHH